MQEQNLKGQGKRFNEGKNRLDLVPTSLIEEVGKVLTFGANKYGANNYKSGMQWSKCIASLKRHLVAFENGIDYDEESGLLHLSHLACNVTFLLEYYKIYPQGDDRPHRYLINNSIGLDIDGVIADFVGAMMNKFPNELKHRPIYWNDPILRKLYKEVINDNDFWLNIEPMTLELPFEPTCYITSRVISNEITQTWLDKNGFPTAPLIQVSNNVDKYKVAKEKNLDMFVDDNFEVFSTMNRNGLLCYLFDAPYNKRYDVGFKRISDLKEIVTYI